MKPNTLYLFHRKFICVLLVVSTCFTVTAGERDTILNAVYSNPFFYNVLSGKDGEIYAGTAQGIFKLQGANLVYYSKQKGYITLGENGEPVINPNGIKNYNEKRYSYLLPYPELVRDEYHAGNDAYFYICSGGRIYIYDIVPYSYSYPNHSIRTISQHFVGTYSGIYLNNLKSGIYPFTDGYIREIDGKAFICFDWMKILDSSAFNLKSTDSIKKSAKILKCPELFQFRDVFKSGLDKKYYLSSVTALLRMQHADDTAKVIYRSANKNGDISIIGESKTTIFFSDGNYLIGFQPTENIFDTLKILPEPILDGSVNNRHLFILTKSALYVINTDNSMERLTLLSKAHTMELTSGTEMIIASDNGLFRFNTVNAALDPLIKEVEFNRRALFLNNGNLYAGSINGLYTINIKDFQLLVNKNLSGINRSSLPPYLLIGLIIASGIIGLLLFLFIRERKKAIAATTQIKELNIETLTREKIETYIQENLSTVSLKSIIDYFNTNKNQIYKLIEPDKPGSIIQQLRMQKVMAMRKAGAELNEISQATGFSESYIKKIRKRES